MYTESYITSHEYVMWICMPIKTVLCVSDCCSQQVDEKYTCINMCIRVCIVIGRETMYYICNVYKFRRDVVYSVCVMCNNYCVILA